MVSFKPLLVALAAATSVLGSPMSLLMEREEADNSTLVELEKRAVTPNSEGNSESILQTPTPGWTDESC